MGLSLKSNQKPVASNQANHKNTKRIFKIFLVTGYWLLVSSSVEATMCAINKTDEEWKQQLTAEQYRVMREKGTEPAFSGKYYHHKETGTYRCGSCGAELFSSETKYNSGSGWPSFWAPIKPESIAYEKDKSHGMDRTEVLCPVCGAHLGHVFDDGPEPTGKRFCINSASLEFKEKK